MRLTEKTVIITGAGSGIGLATARMFAAEGASIVAADWHEQRLDEAVAAVRAMGARVVAAPGNIADASNADTLVDLAVRSFGGLSVLVNNAGVMDYMQGVAELSDDIWRRVMSVNIDGPMYATRRAVHYMLDHGGGAIINIASVGGIRGGAAGAAYTTSKHALIGLTRNTAWMYARRGIRCNAICPGPTLTNIGETMTPSRLDQTGMARAMEFIALAPARLHPDDVAAVALFLASDDARGVSGAVIPVDAGWSAA